MSKYVQHVYIIGAKSIGQYGGFETFVDKLTEYHQNNPRLRYHIACKANGDGHMDETKLTDPVKRIDSHRFLYHNAECFKIDVPNIGAAQAIYYDLVAFLYCYREIRKKKIPHPIIYILACRIGPFMWLLSKLIKKTDGRIFVNPDGHEWMRGKWSKPVRAYWKWSEKLMIKHADHVVCDSKCIEAYINSRYRIYHPVTSYIAYGAEVV